MVWHDQLHGSQIHVPEKLRAVRQSDGYRTLSPSKLAQSSSHPDTNQIRLPAKYPDDLLELVIR
ncbi:MAG: hypothetical protein AAB433_21295, partial [Nitrospirota bacterium]